MSKLSIINAALSRCGVEPLASLDVQSKAAKVAINQYDLTLKECINDTVWNFAVDRLELSQSGEPLFEYTASYELPSDCIRVLSVYGNEPYKIEGKKLVTNTKETIQIKYLKLVTEEYFTASFTKAFWLKLAEDISYHLVQSSALQQAIASEAERYLRRARSYNSQEGTPEGRYPEDYVGGLRL
jgi:hypothetical protein